MGYVIAAIVVLLLVAGFVTFFVLNATRRSGRAAPRDPGAKGRPAGIAAPDESPAGDTTEVSEAREGTDAGGGGGAAHPRVGDPGPEAASGDAEHAARERR
jgi:hypothetical protein